MTRLRFLVLAALLVAACGSGGDQGVEASARSADPTDEADPDPQGAPGDRVDLPSEDQPPEIVVRSEERTLSLRAWTTCWSGAGSAYCADGAPPDELELLTGEELIVEFPIEGWEFTATRRPRSGECGRRQTVDLESVGATTHRLGPIGVAGEDVIDLSGQGPGGDVIVSFRWRTTTDGTMPVPAASLSLLADHDGRVDSYGIELPLQGLAATPAVVDATVTVRAAGGESRVIELAPRDMGTCSDGEVFLSADLQEGLAAAALGDRPFTYEVSLRLDGVEHRARATWPDDEDPECAPCVPLSFEPALPALR